VLAGIWCLSVLGTYDYNKPEQTLGELVRINVQILQIRNRVHQALVAHPYHPSYSESRDQEDLFKANPNTSQNPISKIPNTKK
jgi:hypothetical protein